MSADSDVPNDAIVVNRVGWRVRGASGAGFDYAIHPDLWKSEVCKGVDPTRAARVLKDRGFLVKPESGRLASKVQLPGYHERQRVYLVSGTIIGDGGGATE